MYFLKTLKTALIALVLFGCSAQPKLFTDEEITKAWHSGSTLPIDASAQYPPKPIVPNNDNGMNVLIDVSHQCSFAYLWGIPGQFRNQGYRAIGSMASLNTVLNPKGNSRMRLQYDDENKIYPFGWVPNYRYNVIVTQQSEREAPGYSPEECAALEKFVKDGGSLLVLTTPQSSIEGWSINDLLGQFGASFNSESDKADKQNYATLKIDSNWKEMLKGESGKTIRAARDYGKGKIVVTGSSEDIQLVDIRDDNTPEQKESKKKINEWRKKSIDDIFGLLCENQKQFDEKYRPGQSGFGGGGAIYPELETNLDGFVVYYTPTIDPKLMNAVTNEMPKITDQIMNWLPSTPTDEPMYLLLCAGGGGGWAVNAYKPKENGIISLDVFGLLSIYAHELAHTLGGPANEKGEKAAESPFANQGESHAGWFQGKIDAMYDSTLVSQSVKRCQNFFESPLYAKLDLKRYTTEKAYADSIGHGKDWSKSWVIWQKMDDTYSPAWYPRWKNVQYTRWADDPKRSLTWEETVEDMSIAVGEDLFPFFRAIGTSLNRENMGDVVVAGQTINLPKARIEPFAAPKAANLSNVENWKELK